MTGIEPALSAWEADVLPLNYIRERPPAGRCAWSSLAGAGRAPRTPRDSPDAGAQWDETARVGAQRLPDCFLTTTHARLAAAQDQGARRVTREDRAITIVDLIRGALAAIDHGSIRLLVADIAMPDVDGYELIRRVRAYGGTLPAIAVSAYARPEDRQRAMTAGFNGYCAKPIDAADVLDTVADVLSLR